MASQLGPSASAEYSTVIRISTATQNPYPRTHDLVLTATQPLHILQYCRTMTLAQGHILYEIWDESNEPWQAPRVAGYIVPARILHEVRRVSTRSKEEDWKGLHFVLRQRYEEAWDALVKTWPGIPGFAARKVVERLVRMKAGSGKFEVDQAVVRYAMRNWTGYLVRMEAKRGDGRREFEREMEVEQAVAGRLREVLEKWMRPEVSFSCVREVFEKHGLVQRESFGERPRFI